MPPTEAGCSQGQAAAFFRWLNLLEKPPLSQSGIHATQLDQVSPRTASCSPWWGWGLELTHQEVKASVGAGRGQVTNSSWGVANFEACWRLLNCWHFRGESTNTQLSGPQIFLLRDNHFWLKRQILNIKNIQSKQKPEQPFANPTILVVSRWKRSSVCVRIGFPLCFKSPLSPTSERLAT